MDATMTMSIRWRRTEGGWYRSACERFIIFPHQYRRGVWVLVDKDRSDWNTHAYSLRHAKGKAERLNQGKVVL